MDQIFVCEAVAEATSEMARRPKRVLVIIPNPSFENVLLQVLVEREKRFFVEAEKEDVRKDTHTEIVGLLNGHDMDVFLYDPASRAVMSFNGGWQKAFLVRTAEPLRATG